MTNPWHLSFYLQLYYYIQLPSLSTMLQGTKGKEEQGQQEFKRLW